MQESYLCIFLRHADDRVCRDVRRGSGRVLRAVSFDVDLDAQQNDEPAKDSRSLAPPECRSRDRDKGYPAVNIADALCAFC